MRYKILFFIVALSFLIIPFANAQDSLSVEKITSFNGEIKINTDSTINVTENIAYDFGENQKHGIFRFIPIEYDAKETKRGYDYVVRLYDIKITDENNNPYKFEKTYSGNNINIKIGNPNELISGKKIYVISYTVRRVINFFPEQDELYWNFTGDKWEVPIESSLVEVKFPDSVKIDDRFQNICYEGSFGTNDMCDVEEKENKVVFMSSKVLNPGESMTIVAGWPKGITPEPTMFQKMLDIVRDNWTLLMPIIVFFFMYRLWSKKGRDPKGRGTIIAQYESPDGLAPAEIGTMVDGSADNEDVSSTIIDLAVRGFLKIKRTEEKGFLGTTSTEYTFTKLKDEEPARDFEKEVMKGIFDGEKEKKLSDLKNKFYKTLQAVKSQLYESVTQKGYYAKNPNTVFGMWIAIGIMGGIFLSVFFGILQGGWGTFSGIVSGIIILVFGWLMPAVTKKGAELKENILGFKDFLSVTETDRLKFHNAPEKNPESFEKFLPYAMVLGVENEWAKQFEGVYNQQPDWYEDSSGRIFNAIILSSMISDFNSSAMTTMTSQPSSAAGGGSGFSGGGGGGGGSW